MIALDTNIWVRAILGDDSKQSALARKTIEHAAYTTEIFVPLLVLVELAWVLGSAPGWESTRVQEALEHLLTLKGVEIESTSLARESLVLSTGSVQFADNLIALTAEERGCTKLLTFDARLAKTGRAILLKN